MEEHKEEQPWICRVCTFHTHPSLQSCPMCYTLRPSSSPYRLLLHIPSLSLSSLPLLISTMLSVALTGVFAMVGGLTGAVTGALAGRGAETGLLRAASLGALAGAALSVEVLQASRTYWQSERSGSSSSSSMGDFIEDLLSGRFVQEHVVPAVSATQHWQLNIAEMRYEHFTEMSYEEIIEMFAPGEGGIKGASEELLESLPRHIVSQGNRVDASGDAISCAICLQELEHGDTARSLPTCSHTFHMNCVDRWLIKHVSCPVCRQHM